MQDAEAKKKGGLKTDTKSGTADASLSGHAFNVLVKDVVDDWARSQLSCFGEWDIFMSCFMQVYVYLHSFILDFFPEASMLYVMPA